MWTTVGEALAVLAAAIALLDRLGLSGTILSEPNVTFFGRFAIFVLVALMLERTRKIAELEKDWRKFLAKKEHDFAGRVQTTESGVQSLIANYAGQIQTHVEHLTGIQNRVATLESDIKKLKLPVDTRRSVSGGQPDT